MLIAPAIREEEVPSLRQEVKSLPMLFVWAEDDNTVPYSRKKELLEEFTEKEVLLFGHVLQQGQEEWLAHTPENLKVCKVLNCDSQVTVADLTGCAITGRGIPK